MNKIKFLYIVIFTLLVANILLVGTHFFTKENQKNNDIQPKHIIIERLNFDEKQIAKYDELIKKHQLKIRKRDRKMMDLKRELYHQLINERSIIVDSLTNEIAITQKQIEEIHFKHFKDIQNICKTEQKEAFEELSFELARIFNRHKKHPKRHPKSN